MDVRDRAKSTHSASAPLIDKSTYRQGRKSTVKVSTPLKFNYLEHLHEFRFSEMLRGVYSIRCSPDGQYIAIGFGNGVVKVLKSPTFHEICMLKCTAERSAPFLSLRFHPAKVPLVLYASGTAGYIYSGNLEAATFSSVISEADNEINIMDINTTGDLLATGGKDLTVRFYDIETNTLITKFERQENAPENIAHSLRIFALKFHNELPDIVVTGGWDSCIKIWDRRFSQGLIRSFYGPHIAGDALDVKDDMILTGSWVNYEALQLWDYSSGKLVQTLPFTTAGLETEQLYFCHFARPPEPKDLVYAGGSGTNNVQAINIQTLQVVGLIQFPKTVTTGHSNNNLLAMGSMDNTIKIARVHQP